MELHERYLTALPEATLILEGSTVTWANPAAGLLFRVEPGELAGQSLGSLLAPGDEARVMQRKQRRSEGLSTPEICYVGLQHPDGGRGAADIRFAEIDDGTCIVTLRDVREITRAGNVIERFNRAVSAPEAGSSVASMLAAVEPSFMALGWTGSILVPTGIGNLVRVERFIARPPPGDPLGDFGRSLGDDPTFPAPRTAAVFETGEPLFLEDAPEAIARVIVETTGSEERAEGVRRFMVEAGLLRVFQLPISVDGRTESVLSVSGPDLTEADFVALQVFAGHIGAARRVEAIHEELRRSEREATVGGLAATLAHEVNNSLGSIFNSLNCMRRSPNEALLDIADEEARRIKKLIADLGDYARATTGEASEVDLTETIEWSLRNVRQEVGVVPDVDVQLDLESPLPLVRVDPALARRAIFHLLLQAFERVDGSGDIRVGLWREAGRVHLQVADTGPPLEAEAAARVFEPFAGEASGSALGMALVERVARQFGGDVRCENGEREVAFSLWLPGLSEPAAP